MKPAIKAVHAKLGDRVVAMMEFGSRIYGTALPESDWDYKGIMLPTADELLLNETASGFTERSNPSDTDVKNGPDDVDIEFYSLYRFLELLGEGQTVAIDMLFAPQAHLLAWTPIMERVWEMRFSVLNKHCGAAIGYAKAQAHKYSLRGDRIRALETVLGNMSYVYTSKPRMPLEGWIELVGGKEKFMMFFDDKTSPYIRFVKSQKPPQTDHLEVCGKQAGLPSTVKFAYELFKAQFDEYGLRARAAREAGGADWKAMYHALRISAQTVELLMTGQVSFPRPEAPYLLRVRQGQVPVEEVSERIERGIQEIRDAQALSTLRDDPDRKAIRAFLREVHLDIIKKAYP